jgi:hypothetical protein
VKHYKGPVGWLSAKVGAPKPGALAWKLNVPARQSPKSRLVPQPARTPRRCRGRRPGRSPSGSLPPGDERRGRPALAATDRDLPPVPDLHRPNRPADTGHDPRAPLNRANGTTHAIAASGSSWRDPDRHRCLRRDRSRHLGPWTYVGPGSPLELRGAAKPVASSRVSRHCELGRRLWERSTELTRVDVLPTAV